MGAGDNIRVFLDTEEFYRENSRLTQAIEKTQAGTVLYEAEDAPKIPDSRSADRFGGQCDIRVTKHRSFEAAMNLHREYPDAKICVLNFASAVNPGGGVKSGSSAQEEGLCRCSTLYPCLDYEPLWESYYNVNRAAHNPLNSDACIYTPGIVICKTDTRFPERLEEEDWVSIDVISCAAPDLRHVPYNKYNPQTGEPVKLTDQEQYALHLKRAKHILHTAAVNGEDILVLGAFGCGAFENNPVPVAKAFHDALEEYQKYFRAVEFAVFCKKYETGNYDAFEREFKGTKTREKIGGFDVCSFDCLTTAELYEILRARADVFISEEKILYPDADGIDYDSLHVFRLDENGRVTAYLRLYPKTDEPFVIQMGRVLTREHGRGTGRELLSAGVQAAAQLMKAKEIYVESQKHAEGFYLKGGFEVTSGEFIEAGIPHVQMRKFVRKH